MTDKHIIFTNGRSGSNFVVNTLNKHTEIVNFGEVLGPWTMPYKIFRIISWLGVSNKYYINQIYSRSIIYYVAQLISAVSHFRKKAPLNIKLIKNVKSIGVKDFSFLIKQRNLKEWLIKNEEIKIIYLYRENILKRYLSLVMMQQTGVVKSESKSIKKTIKVDVDDMIKELNIYSEQKEYEDSIIELVPKERVLKICYENYFFDDIKMKENTRNIFNFIGVDPIDIYSNHKKINSDNLESLIVNYNEVEGMLKGTEFYKYIS